MMQDSKPAQGANFDTPPDEWMAGPEISNDGGFESGVADGEEEDDHDPAIMDLPDIEGFEASGPKYWPDNDEDSPFYRHLLENGASPANKQFLFHKGALDLYCAANRFAFKGKNDVIVFGMRGARLLDQEYHENVESLPLEIARPDHYNFRCVIGYYFRSTGTFSAYTASTVPWHGYITAGKKTNVLALGCYIYARGPHLRQGPVIPAFRVPDERSVLTVLRRGTSKFFDFRGSWDTNGDIWDNIHCAYGDKKFSSQGCQTVKGGKDSGLWGRFQSEIKKLGDGRVDYMLLTGDEASIAAIHADEGKSLADPQTHQRLSRLRIGSEGEEVRRLLELLKLKSSTYFGPHVMAALIKAQKEKGLPADGIFSPALEAHFGSVFVAAGSPVVVDLQPKPPEPKLPGGGQPTQPDAPVGGGGTPPLPPGGGQPLPKPDVPLADTGGGTTGGKRTEATALLTRGLMAQIAPLKDASKQAIWDRYVDAIVSDKGAEIFAKFKVADSKARMAYIIGNMAAETGNFSLLRESMVWKTPSALAALAKGDVATATRLINEKDWEGVGDWLYGITAPRQYMCKWFHHTQPKDGFRFRGGGLLQTTGRYNYRKLGEACGLGKQLEDNPDLIEDPYISLQTACAQWQQKGLNELTDQGNYLACCKGINLGNPKSTASPKGMPHRNSAVRAACKAFGIPAPASASIKSSGGFESTGAGEDTVYEYGDEAPEIAEVQRKLGDLGYDVGSADGVFDEQTRDAVLSFQAMNGLPTTGLIGKEMRQAVASPEAAMHWSLDGHGAREDDSSEPGSSTLQDAAPLRALAAIPPEMMVSDNDLRSVKFVETYRGTRLFALTDGRVYLEGSVAVSSIEHARATLDLLASK